ncbi:MULTISPECIES: LytTR family DNA-binding domain-containing protein [unclassified Sedimentibacter]|uniref:LytTR family DNA-binding domain-containing protein n=1 Tax=unclassified Sedimentibacter TaxID=2649220 RepID=UPI0027DF9856|nr:LytTR family DNA-binding domain-containing protein [Sedimentibacter sp. MB35-C1]WMJ78089.1 LytTR family DNA-binding domain-containing protein [Sedimentibacter sp. MB35-C1]
MLKIVLHCNSKSIKKIESELSEYFNKRNTLYKLYQVGSSSEFLSSYLPNKDFQLLLIYKNDRLSYIIKTYHNFDKDYMHMVSGTLEFPLNHETIDKVLFNNIENTHCCPYGIYNVNNKTVFRRVLHEDIEYIRRTKNQTIVYLKNGETEKTSGSINKIMNELNEKYFIKCCKGYIVNIFNVKKINKDTNTVELKSGTKLPLTKVNFRKFLKTYITSMAGFKIFDD